MIVVDKRFVKAFTPHERLVMLDLLVDADEKGVSEFDIDRQAEELHMNADLLAAVYKKLEKDKVIKVLSINHIAIVDFEGYLPNSGKKRKKRTEVVPKKPLAERQHDFGLSLTAFIDTNGGKYPKEMIRAFYDYWSEPNQAQTKMKCEMMDTWSTAGRLATWARKDKNFNKNQNNNYGRETITDKIQRSAAESIEFSRKLKAQREANLGNGDSEKVW